MILNILWGVLTATLIEILTIGVLTHLDRKNRRP